MNNNPIQWKKVKPDSSGTPRFVCHFLPFVTSKEQTELWNQHGLNTVHYMYMLGLSRSRQFGGRKFHNKQYGGGIAFSVDNPSQLEERINAYMESLQDNS